MCDISHIFIVGLSVLNHKLQLSTHSNNVK